MVTGAKGEYMDIAYNLEMKLNEIITSADVEEYRQSWLEMLKRKDDKLPDTVNRTLYESSEAAASVKRMPESSIRDIIYQKVLGNDDFGIMSHKMADMITEYQNRMVQMKVTTKEVMVTHEDVMSRRLPGCYGTGKRSR